VLSHHLKSLVVGEEEVGGRDTDLGSIHNQVLPKYKITCWIVERNMKAQ
jgi:hypothetical protein